MFLSLLVNDEYKMNNSLLLTIKYLRVFFKKHGDFTYTFVNIIFCIFTSNIELESFASLIFTVSDSSTSTYSSLVWFYKFIMFLIFNRSWRHDFCKETKFNLFFPSCRWHEARIGQVPQQDMRSLGHSEGACNLYYYNPSNINICLSMLIITTFTCQPWAFDNNYFLALLSYSPMW